MRSFSKRLVRCFISQLPNDFPRKNKKSTHLQVPSKDILIWSVGEVPKNHPKSPILLIFYELPVFQNPPVIRGVFGGVLSPLSRKKTLGGVSLGVQRPHIRYEWKTRGIVNIHIHIIIIIIIIITIIIIIIIVYLDLVDFFLTRCGYMYRTA